MLTRGNDMQNQKHKESPSQNGKNDVIRGQSLHGWYLRRHVYQVFNGAVNSTTGGTFLGYRIACEWEWC